MKKVLRGPGMYLMLFLLIYLFARLMSPGDAASKAPVSYTHLFMDFPPYVLHCSMDFV